MTQYWEDFSGYTVGDDPTVDGPAGFTKRWHTTLNPSIISDVDGPAGKAMQVTQTVQGASVLSWDAVNGDANRDNVDIAMLVRIPNHVAGSENFAGPVVRAAGTDASETGYAMTVYGASEGLAAVKYVSAAAAFMLNDWASPRPVAGGLYWLFIRADGSSLTYSFAAKDTPETIIDSWATTNGEISAPGWVGLYGVTTHTLEVLAIGVGTNGDAAPTSDPGGGGDVTAPVLSSPTGAATGSTTASGGVTTDEGNGTLYAVCTTSATPPSIAQIQAGQDHTGSAAPYATSQAVSAAGAQAVAATGLTPSTGYQWHFVQPDAAGNDSNVVTSAQFTTNAAAAVEGVSFTLYQSDGTTPAASLTNLVALWWDSATPTGAPAVESTSESTDASGLFTMDVSAGTLAVGQTGFLMLYDLDGGDHRDSLVYASREAVVDIS